MSQTEVCIVGAGPAGLVLALLLRQAQIPCVVLEQRGADALRRRAGAGLIEHRTVRRLDAHGLAEPILTGGGTNRLCEFRVGRQALVLDYGALTLGRGHFVYPQHELVGALAERLLAAGGEIRFGTRVTAVEQDGDAVAVAAVDERGEPATTRCRFVAGCDGASSTLLGALRDATVIELRHPFRWLALIAQVAPSKDRTLYGLHPRGFAGQMRRGPELTRYMLEVPRTDTLATWPDDRIWAELEERLGAAGEPALARGPVLERDVLDLRARVVEPMHDGRVYLTGDAAHLITPAGGKGMNLAIQDALELAAGLRERYDGDPAGTRLAGYSATRLPAIWRTQEFSNWMLSMLDAGLEPNEFGYRLRRARLEELIADQRLGRWFAHAYAGVDA